MFSEGFFLPFLQKEQMETITFLEESRILTEILIIYACITLNYNKTYFLHVMLFKINLIQWHLEI